MSEDEMTVKEALGVLHELYCVHTFTTPLASGEKREQEKVFLRRAIRAMFRLSVLVHGQTSSHEALSLCERCHVHRVMMENIRQMVCPTCLRKEEETHVHTAHGELVPATNDQSPL